MDYRRYMDAKLTNIWREVDVRYPRASKIRHKYTGIHGEILSAKLGQNGTKLDSMEV